MKSIPDETLKLKPFMTRLPVEVLRAMKVQVAEEATKIQDWTLEAFMHRLRRGKKRAV